MTSGPNRTRTRKSATKDSTNALPGHRQALINVTLNRQSAASDQKNMVPKAARSNERLEASVRRSRTVCTGMLTGKRRAGLADASRMIWILANQPATATPNNAAAESHM